MSKQIFKGIKGLFITTVLLTVLSLTPIVNPLGSPTGEELPPY